ncbi:hypothetical protein HPP92_000998 [Vanilla planifolia]|uniref:SPRY domain-containing protein n=1 Tax=Vanilla planifolia TaxID=51239 RepID=A0A835S6U6_VANPL|nr:hypothetical protein HPP92_000998 [Vanilla planifolia]
MDDIGSAYAQHVTRQKRVESGADATMETKRSPAETGGVPFDFFKLSSRWDCSAVESSLVETLAVEEEPSHLNTFNSPACSTWRVQANCPAPTRRIAYYFEMTVKNAGQKGHVAIGFTTKDVNLRRQPGWDANSCGYHGMMDVFTMDMVKMEKVVLVEENGEIVGTVCKGIKGLLYPTIAVHGPNEEVVVNFGKQPFRFDIEVYYSFAIISMCYILGQRLFALICCIMDTKIPLNSFDVESGIMSPHIPASQENGYHEQGDAYALNNRRTFMAAYSEWGILILHFFGFVNGIPQMRRKVPEASLSVINSRKNCYGCSCTIGHARNPQSPVLDILFSSASSVSPTQSMPRFTTNWQVSRRPQQVSTRDATEAALTQCSGTAGAEWRSGRGFRLAQGGHNDKVSPPSTRSVLLMTTSSPSALSVTPASEFLKEEVPDWDDEVASTARFKALSGQRSDWEPQFCFWRDLILKVARHLGVCVVRASELKNTWFSRGGLIPLCMDQVLHEMHVHGDILLRGELTDPTSGHFYRLLRQAAQVMGVFRPSSLEDGTDDTLILRELLQERAADVTKTLAARNWTSSCVITMKMFQSLCNGFGESTVILAYLCESRKAQYLSVRKKEFVELLSSGYKAFLSSSSVSPVTNFDSDILHLMWTTEKLQQQVDTINQQWETSKKMALASLKSGNKPASYRHIRQAKLFSQKRAKCTSFLERVEEVLSIISDAESTKKVSEAIQIERMPLQSDIEDEDIEEEFEKLEMELAEAMLQPQIHKSVPQEQATIDKAPGLCQRESTELSQTLSKLNIKSAQLEAQICLPFLNKHIFFDAWNSQSLVCCGCSSLFTIVFLNPGNGLNGGLCLKVLDEMLCCNFLGHKSKDKLWRVKNSQASSHQALQVIEALAKTRFGLDLHCCHVYELPNLGE